jgi:hypothetical protein
MSQPCSWSDVAGTSTPYPRARPEQRAGITGHGSVLEAQEHQEARAGAKLAPGSMINFSEAAWR